MYRCCRKVILFILIFSGSVLWADVDEDKEIFQAMEAMDSGNFNGAVAIYLNLYKQTQKLEYLKEVVLLYAQMGDNASVAEYAKSYYTKDKNDVMIDRMLSSHYASVKDYDNAIAIALNILTIDDNADNNRFLGTLYALKKDFKNARKYTLKAFKMSGYSNLLLSIIYFDLLDGDIEDSLALLKKTYSDTIDPDVAMFLNSSINSFENTNIKDKLERFYSDYYAKSPNDQNAFYLASIYLVNNKPKDALKLSNNHKFDDNFMLDLYLNNKEYSSALNLANNLLEKTKNKFYLGSIAIIEFEMAQDKSSVLDSVITKLKDSLNSGANHVYSNYLGYLLIDYDIDIDLGIKYVKNALNDDPNNIAYIDSLAWGYYKNNDCKNAKIEIDKIKDKATQDEIIKHIEEIKKCSN